MPNACCRIFHSINWKLCMYVISILLPFALAPLAFSPNKEAKCAYVLILVAAYWLLEPVPISVTALLPVVLFPLLGIVGSFNITANYMKESFIMFIGGFTVAVAVEDCMLHERIALRVLLIVGSEIKWLMLGFMMTSMFLSMWISNSAATAMMLPIVEAVLSKITNDGNDNNITPENSNDEATTEDQQMDENEEGNDSGETSTGENDTSEPRASVLKVALLLCVCYSANIGGTGTITGAAPNLVLKAILEGVYPDSEEITYVSWIIYSVPGMVLCVLFGWLYLWLAYIQYSKVKHNLVSNEVIKTTIAKRYAKLGPISYHEIEVVILFFILVSLWIFRDPKFIRGWSEAIGSDAKIGDSVPAIGVAFLMFLLPSNPTDWNSRPILHWKTAERKLPWGAVLLLGGGFALSEAAQRSGLSELLGDELCILDALPLGLLVAVICFTTAMATEILANTTAATIFLPVLNQIAVNIKVNPLYLMIPVTIACSYAFMLPVATPPNVIVFESGNMKIMDMAKPGFVMNVLCCAVQLLMLNTLGVAMFDLKQFPSWANITLNTTLKSTRRGCMFPRPPNITTL